MKTITSILPFLLIISLLHANTFYVSPAGNNANTGLSLATAFRTLQKAADVVQAGDSVLVADSTYAGFDIRTDGTAANPIVFITLGSNVIINRRNTITTDGINIEGADWIEIKGFRVINQPRAGIRVVLSDNVSIRNNICTNNSRWGIFTGFTDNFLAEYNECAYSAIEHGIYVSNSSDNAIIRYNVSHHNRAAGLHFNGDISQGEDGINHNPQVYNNIIYRNGLGGGSAINMDGNQNALIYNNLIYDNYATGIALYQIDGGGPSSGARIFHNTIVQDDTSRWAILLVNGAINASVKNNIIINQHSFRGSINISDNSRAGFQSDYNILSNRFTLTDGSSVIDSTAWKNLGYDAHSFFSPSLTALFTNTLAGDYTLKAGSKAIDFGTNSITPSITTDLNNTSRPQGNSADVGAYESSGSVSLPLTWINYTIGLQGTNNIVIQGNLGTVTNGTIVTLKKWNSISKQYESVESKTIIGDYSTYPISFVVANAPKGKYKFIMEAKEIGKSPIATPALSISVTRSSAAMIFYPNPTQDFVYVQNTVEMDFNKVTIQDLNGKLIKSIVTDSTINLKDILPGTYIITLHRNNEIIQSSSITKF